MKKYLIISTTNDVIRIAPERIVYISSDGNYCNIYKTDNESKLITYQLGQIEKIISSQLGNEGSAFIRIGKSYIVNRSYIYYINITRQKLVLSDVSSFTYTISPSKEALKLLKEMIEKEVSNE